MTVTQRIPRMSRDQFLVWAQNQEARFEFDGFAPVAMTGGTRTHSRIAANLLTALVNRLAGNPCEALADAGVVTIGDAVRYPDAMVTCTNGPGSALVIPGAVVVFEIVSPTSARVDRIIKPREYAAVPTIRAYVIIEYEFAGLHVHTRPNPDAQWTTTTLTVGDRLLLPDIGIEIPVIDLYAGVDLPDVTDEGPTS